MPGREVRISQRGLNISMAKNLLDGPQIYPSGTCCSIIDLYDDFSPRAWLKPECDKAVMTVCPEEWRHKFENSNPIPFPSNDVI